MTKTKTIFITSFFGLIARNILATDMLKILAAQRNLRLVILAPKEKEELYRREFGSGNVIVEGVTTRAPSRLERFLAAVFLQASDTSARRIHRLIGRKRDRKYLRFCLHWLFAVLSRFKAVRSTLRWLDYRLAPRDTFHSYFERYQPELVFATDVFQPDDLALMRGARRRNLAVIGMVRSWDNITSKGLNRFIPDLLIVNSEKIKEEAVRLNDVPAERIVTVGIPHYDKYVREERRSRSELFRALKIDPNKKTVLFAPPSDIYAQEDPIGPLIIEALAALNAQIIVRLYLVGKVNLGEVKPVPNKIAIDVPVVGGDFIQADLTAGDAHLADLLASSDVIVAFASTLVIDAVVFGKPVVFIGFDGEPNRPYWQSLRRFYDYDHQRSILKTGGVRLARTPEELVQYVQAYLENPSLDKRGRQKIIEERCWKLDGRSGERLAAILLETLDRDP